MPLTTIFVIRHAFRGSWDTNPLTGEVTARFPSPTGLPADPPLTAYGEKQARELAALASDLRPRVARIYTSPYFRCIQTIEPFARQLNSLSPPSPSSPQSHHTHHTNPKPGQDQYHQPTLGIPLVLDRGLSEWFGTAPWEHPKPASYHELAGIFPHLDLRPFWAPHSNEQERMEMLKEYQSQLKALEAQNLRRIQKNRRKNRASVGSKPQPRPLSLSTSASPASSPTAANIGARRIQQNPDLALREYARQLEMFELQSRKRAADMNLDIDEPPMTAPLPRMGHSEDSISPSPWGESTLDLHGRVAYALERIIGANDAMLSPPLSRAGDDGDRDDDDDGARSIVVVSHAAPIIAMGRTLTGNMPADVCERDFCTNTAGVTRFERRPGWEQRRRDQGELPVWEDGEPVPHIPWRDGRGVGGGWDCVQNSGTAHLSGGANRDWHFSGEESFLPPGQHVPGGQDTDDENAPTGNEGVEKSKL